MGVGHCLCHVKKSVAADYKDRLLSCLGLHSYIIPSANVVFSIPRSCALMFKLSSTGLWTSEAFKVAVEKWLRPPDRSYGFMSPTGIPVLAVKGNVCWVTMLSSAKESLFRIHWYAGVAVPGREMSSGIVLKIAGHVFVCGLSQASIILKCYLTMQVNSGSDRWRNECGAILCYWYRAYWYIQYIDQYVRLIA